MVNRFTGTNFCQAIRYRCHNWDFTITGRLRRQKEKDDKKLRWYVDDEGNQFSVNKLNGLVRIYPEGGGML